MLLTVNNIRKASGTSTFSLALGILLAEATDLAVLLIDANYLFSDIDGILGIESDRGLDDVLDLLNSNKLTEKLFKDITIELGNFYLLTGSKISQYNRFELESISSYNKLFTITDYLFDIVIVDSPTKKMLNYLNEKGRTYEKYLNIQLAKQNFLIFEKYIRSAEYNMDKSVVIINKYVEGRKFDKNRIINEYRIKVPVFTLRHSEKLIDAFNDRLIDRYLLNENDGFIEDMKIFMNYLADLFRFQLKSQYVIKKTSVSPVQESKKKRLFW